MVPEVEGVARTLRTELVCALSPIMNLVEGGMLAATLKVIGAPDVLTLAVGATPSAQRT